MKKMRTLFEQDRDFKVIPKLRDENYFVISGNFEASIKRDGTSVMIKDNIMYKRYDANANKGRQVPSNAILCQEEPTPNGSFPVWIPVNQVNPADKYHIEAFAKQDIWENGTYELCGPAIGSNKEKLDELVLFKHGSEIVEFDEVNFEVIKEYLKNNFIEGLIFKDTETGLMTKIRRKDFGLPW